MSGTGRRKSATNVYHVMGRGGNNEKIFDQIRERRQFLKILQKYLEQYQVDIHVYCIMPNHYHMIIEAEIEELSMFMAKIQAEYAKYYNYKHYRQGYVFQSRFKSECIENEKYYWDCVRYIHCNPAKAKIVRVPEKYDFSSMNEFGIGKGTILSKKVMKMYKMRFKNRKEFLIFHKSIPTARFVDTIIDSEAHLNEWAKLILMHMQKEYHLHIPQEVFEIKEIRGAYQERLKTELHLSEPKTKKLYQKVRQEIAENVCEI